MRECECERAWSEGQLRESVGGVFVRGAAAALFTTRRQTTRQDTAGQDWTRHDATRREMSRPDPTRPDSTRPDTTRHDTTRHGTARHGTARHGTARHDTTRRDATPRDATRRHETLDSRHERTQHLDCESNVSELHAQTAHGNRGPEDWGIKGPEDQRTREREDQREAREARTAETIHDEKVPKQAHNQSLIITLRTVLALNFFQLISPSSSKTLDAKQTPR